MVAAWLFVELGAMFLLGSGQRLGDRAAGTFVVEKANLVTENVSGTPGEVAQQAEY